MNVSFRIFELEIRVYFYLFYLDDETSTAITFNPISQEVIIGSSKGKLYTCSTKKNSVKNFSETVKFDEISFGIWSIKCNQSGKLYLTDSKNQLIEVEDVYRTNSYNVFQKTGGKLARINGKMIKFAEQK